MENRIKLINHGKQPHKYENGWTKIHVSDVKRIISSTENLIKKQVLKVSSSMEEIRHIGTYNILISASKPGYWLQSKVDRVLNTCVEREESGDSPFWGMTYEQGVEQGIRWLLGETDYDPVAEEG